MNLRRISIVIFAVSMAWAGLGEAEAAMEKESSDNSVPLPVIPRGQGENCVADTQIMRVQPQGVRKLSCSHGAGRDAGHRSQPDTFLPRLSRLRSGEH